MKMVDRRRYNHQNSEEASTNILDNIILSWDLTLDFDSEKNQDIEYELESLKKSVLIASRTSFKKVPSGRLEKLQNQLLNPLRVFENLKVIPLEFKGVEEYIFSFYPIFLLETKQAVYHSLTTEMSKPERVNFVSYSSVLEMVDICFERIYKNINSSDPIEFTQNSLTLLSFQKTTEDEFMDSTLEAGNKPFYLSNQFKHNVLGIIVDDYMKKTVIHMDSMNSKADYNLNQRKQQIKDNKSNIPKKEQKRTVMSHYLIIKVFYPIKGISKDFSKARNELEQALYYSSDYKWKLSLITNLATVHREFRALLTFPTLGLRDQLLSVQEETLPIQKEVLPPIQEETEKLNTIRTVNERIKSELAVSNFFEIVENKSVAASTLRKSITCSESKYTLYMPKALKAKLKTIYNSSQLSAIKDCQKFQGITLIQGPPGTGKTTTIIGIISVILNSSVKRTATEKQDTDENKIDDIFGQKSGVIQRQPWAYDFGYVSPMDNMKDLTNLVEANLTLKPNKFEHKPIKLFSVTGERLPPRRILVCAPSNAAIDEILKRLVLEPDKNGGILNKKGERNTPYVVRIGPNVHPDYEEFSLEKMVEKRLSHDHLNHGATSESLKYNIKKTILLESQIVCTTLSSSGSRDAGLLGDKAFDTVVIDEASQAVELATLIPLASGCKRLILVGDPKQLPATVFSSVSLLFNYAQSLFQRFALSGAKVNLLSVQYRMHPHIALFNSKAFYENKVTNAPNIINLVKPPIPWYGIPLFYPVVFFNVESTEEREDKLKSYMNTKEARLVCELLNMYKILMDSKIEEELKKSGKTFLESTGEKGEKADAKKTVKKVAELGKKILEKESTDKTSDKSTDVDESATHKVMDKKKKVNKKKNVPGDWNLVVDEKKFYQDQKKKIKELAWMNNIAIISPYAEQVRVLRKVVRTLFQIKMDDPIPIDINTVDGFQGQEKDVIIFSAIRAQFNRSPNETEKKNHIGFLADKRRINVALTRARCNLWVIGHENTLNGNIHWKQFCLYATKNNFKLSVDFKKSDKLFVKPWLIKYFENTPSAWQAIREHAPTFLELLKSTSNNILNQTIEELKVISKTKKTSNYSKAKFRSTDDVIGLTSKLFQIYQKEEI